MIRIRFQTANKTFYAMSEAGNRLTFADGSLRRDAESVRLACYADEAWYVGHEPFEDIVVDRPVYVHFENRSGEKSPECGPISHFRAHDGCAYSGEELLASHRDGGWVEAATGVHWEEMVLSDARVTRTRAARDAGVSRPER